MRAKTFLKAAACAAIFSALILQSGCFNFGFGGTTRGNGRMVSGAFSHDGVITKINLIGMPAILNLTPESSNELTYIIDENLKDLIEITHRNGVLTISTRNNVTIIGNGITFNIGTDRLEGILINGATTIDGRGTFNADSFTLEVNGAGGAELELDAGSVSVVVNGAARIDLSGTADSLSINNNGAAIITARRLIAQDAAVTLNGAGSVQVHAERTLNASVAGVGSVTYWGSPALTRSVAGLGAIRRGE